MYQILPDPDVKLPPRADFRKKLEYLMLRDGYSYWRLGFKLGISGTEVWRYAIGKHLPRREVVTRMCKLFGVAGDWLMRTEEA